MAEKTISLRTYCGVYVCLLVLLGLTMLVSVWNLGALNLLASLAIAITKGTLIVLFFMHLRYAHPATRLFAAAGVLWLTLLIGLTMCDVMSRRHSLQSNRLPLNQAAQAPERKK